MTEAEPLAQYAIKPYRYLRLAIVVVVLSLIASVLIERAKSTCWQESAPPTQSCASSPFGPIDAESSIDNNVLALAIGGVVAIGIALLAAKLQNKVTLQRVDRPSQVGLLLTVGLTIAGLIWYFGFRDNFLEHAHSGAAIAMFVIVGLVIALNARHAPRNYRLLYATLAGFMAAAFVGVVVTRLLVDDWRHSVLWLELLELIPFAGFWGAQTLEHWDGVLRTTEPGVASP